MVDERHSVFQRGIHFANVGRFLEADACFARYYDAWPQDRLADEALLNRATCQYSLGHHRKARELAQTVISRHPDGTLDFSSESNESGKTSAKALYLCVVCSLALAEVDTAREAMRSLEEDGTSGLIKDGVFTSFRALARKALSRVL